MKIDNNNANSPMPNLYVLFNGIVPIINMVDMKLTVIDAKFAFEADYFTYTLITK
jgi:hypothetical protein